MDYSTSPEIEERLRRLKSIEVLNIEENERGQEISTLGIIWGEGFKEFLELIIRKQEFATDEIKQLYQHVLDSDKSSFVTYKGALTLLLRKLCLYYENDEENPFKPLRE